MHDIDGAPPTLFVRYAKFLEHVVVRNLIFIVCMKNILLEELKPIERDYSPTIAWDILLHTKKEK